MRSSDALHHNASSPDSLLYTKSRVQPHFLQVQVRCCQAHKQANTRRPPTAHREETPDTGSVMRPSDASSTVNLPVAGRHNMRGQAAHITDLHNSSAHKSGTRPRHISSLCVNESTGMSPHAGASSSKGTPTPLIASSPNKGAPCLNMSGHAWSQ